MRPASPRAKHSPRLPVTRKHELLERQRARRASDPFGGFSALVRGPEMPRVLLIAGPDLRTRRRRPADYWRAGARHVRRRLSRRRPGAQRLQLPHDARRLRSWNRARMRWAARFSRRESGKPSSSSQAIGELQARRLCRHAELPAHPGREGHRDRQRCLQHPAEGLAGGEALPAERCATGSPSAAWPSTRATRRPTSA